MDISYPKLIIYYYDIDGFIFSMKHKYQGARYLSASELLLGHAAAAGLQHAGVDHLHPGAGLAAAGAQGLDLEHHSSQHCIFIQRFGWMDQRADLTMSVSRILHHSHPYFIYEVIMKYI